MREVSFVNKLKFNFSGSVTKRALVIGDADNDQCNELVCASLQGDLAVFKDKDANKYAYASELGMVTACIVGDLINAGRNCIAAINTEGWLFIFDVARSGESISRNVSPDEPQEAVDNLQQSTNDEQASHSIKLNVSYEQRMPANCKDLLLADLDGDGQNELIVGLTDRVLRTYKWVTIGADRGKFVGLYKWEFADQIGSVSLNPSRHENCQDIIVAQPGGTYAKLECFDKKPTSASANLTPPNSSARLEQITNETNQQQHEVVGADEDNVRTEYISKLTPEYHQLALAQMRNHHISTEVLGGIRDNKNPDSHSLIVIATLDGTLMLVNKDEILWSIQVDHQLFALAMLESTKSSDMDSGGGGGDDDDDDDDDDDGDNYDVADDRPKLSQSESTCTIVPNSKFDQERPMIANSSGNTKALDCDSLIADGKRKISQYFAVCAWNGKTYIVDEERNYLRFKFDEAVSAFTAGNYYFDGRHHSALVYATFNNQIILYHDILANQIRPMYLLNEVIENQHYSDLLRKLERLKDQVSTDDEETSEDSEAIPNRRLQELLHSILYSVTDQELGISG